MMNKFYKAFKFFMNITPPWPGKETFAIYDEKKNKEEEHEEKNELN